MTNYNVVLFDLDGTLIDSSEGIFNSIRYAEEKLNLNRLDDRMLPEFVGPPPTKSYQKFHGLDEDVAKIATKYHREYSMKKGMYESQIYPGIKELLMELKKKDYYLSVATLKSQAIAEKILQHFGIFHLFDSVVGIDVDEELTKAKIIEIALDKIVAAEKIAVMVGDSESDAIGAYEANVDFIGVTYGFGFKNQHNVNKFQNIGYSLNPESIIKLVK